jgi:hypothetical protein
VHMVSATGITAPGGPVAFKLPVTLVSDMARGASDNGMISQ